MHVDTRKSDLVAVQRQKRKSHECHLLVAWLGGSAYRGRRVPGITVLLQNVHGTIEIDQMQKRVVLCVHVHQGSLGIPAPEVSHNILYVHVDLVSNAVPSVHCETDEKFWGKEHAQLGSSEYNVISGDSNLEYCFYEHDEFLTILLYA